MIDLLCLAVLGLQACLGWRRGLLLSALSLASLLGGYLGAFLLYRPLGHLLGRRLSLQPLLAYPLGGLAAFLLTALVLFVLGRVLRRRRSLASQARRAGAPGRPHSRRGAEPELWRRLSVSRRRRSGLAAGELSRLRARRALLAGGPQRGAPDGQAGPGAGQSSSSAPPALAGVANRMARDPLRTAQSLGVVIDDPRLRALGGSPGTASRARAEEGALRRLAADAEFLRRAEEAGLIQRAEAGPLAPEQAYVQLTARLAPLRRALDELARDPQVRKLLDDPALLERLRRRDLLGPTPTIPPSTPSPRKCSAPCGAAAPPRPGTSRPQRRQRPQRRAAPAAPAAPAASAAPAAPAAPQRPQRPQRQAESGKPRRTVEDRIYRWKDGRGRIHYGNDPPSGVACEEWR